MLQILMLALSLGSLICYIMVVVKMFQHGKTGPGLFSTLGLLLCGIGWLFAFIYGWMKAGEWRIKNLMIAWTVLFLAYLGVAAVAIPSSMQQLQKQVEQLEKQQNIGQPVPGAPVIEPPSTIPAPGGATPEPTPGGATPEPAPTTSPTPTPTPNP